MIEHRSVVHLVFQNCEALVLLMVDLTEQVKLLLRGLKHQLSVWAHMSCCTVLLPDVKDLLARRLGAVEISLETTGHAEVVYE